MNKPSSILRFSIPAGTALLLIIWAMDSMWSGSGDLAHHYALVARIAEFWNLPPGTDPSLGEMNYYPRTSHAIAALIGTVFGSSIIGMQLLTLVSLIGLWTSLHFILLSLPRSAAIKASMALISLLILNRYSLHVSLHGQEIIGNFFFSQLVAQAVAVLALVTALYMEKNGTSPFVRYAYFLVLIPFITGIHLLPAIELLGVLSILIAIDALIHITSNRPGPVKKAVIGLALICIATMTVVLHPAFKAMKMISEGNGEIGLSYIRTLPSLAILCLIVMAVSAVLILKWFKFNAEKNGEGFAALKYLGAYGIAASGLCLLQIVALRFGLGSEYAAKKYAFGLGTVLLVEICLLIGVSRVAYSAAATRAVFSPFHFYCLPSVLIATSFLFIVPSKKMLDTSDLVTLERQIQQLRNTVISKTPGKDDYAVKIAGMPPSIAYLFSIGTLKAPRVPNSLDIFSDRQIRDLSTVGTIITSENAKPYDIAACRRYVSPNSIVLINADCLAKALSDSQFCTGVFNFTDQGVVDAGMVNGFSVPEPNGRWTDGRNASFSCSIPKDKNKMPTVVRIDTTAFVYRGRSQTVLVSLNGAKPVEYRYQTGQERQVVVLPVKKDIGEHLRIDLTLPDAVSPKDVGMNEDIRKLGIMVKSVAFE